MNHCHATLTKSRAATCISVNHALHPDGVEVYFVVHVCWLYVFTPNNWWGGLVAWSRTNSEPTIGACALFFFLQAHHHKFIHHGSRNSNTCMGSSSCNRQQ